MQDSTNAGILGMIFFWSMGYVLLMVIVSLIFSKSIIFNGSIHGLKKRRELRRTYVREPMTNNKKLRIVYRINRFTGPIMGLMFWGQVFVANYGYPYLATSIVCLLCLIGWWSIRMSSVRRDYWKNHSRAEFTLVSDKRFLFNRVLAKSILVAMIVMSVSYSIFVVNYGTYY